MLCKLCGSPANEHDKFSGHSFTTNTNWFLTGMQQVESKVNPKFHSALAKMAEVHDKKSQDYAHDGNRYSNFEEAAATAGVSVDEVFAVLIGIKLARLRELLSSGKVPNNESIQDTRLDLAVYSVLWLSYHEGEK